MSGTRTFVLIKPDATKRGLIPEILARLQRAGLEIEKLESNFGNRFIASQHYIHLKAVSEDVYDRNVRFISEGHCVAVLLSGPDAVATARAACGSASVPAKCAPGSIRHDLATDTIEKATAEKRGLENRVHSSDSDEAAEREIALWFTSTET